MKARIALSWLVLAPSTALAQVGAGPATPDEPPAEQEAPGVPDLEVRAIESRPVHSLASLVASAVERYPGIDAAAAGIDAAEARLREARTSPFMQFQVDLGGSVVPNAEGTPVYTPGGQLGDLGAWGPAASIQLSGGIPLYTFGRLREAWAAAEAGIDASEAASDRALAQLRVDVLRAYYTLSFALDVLQMISEGEGRLESAVRRVDQRIEEEDPDVEPSDRYRLLAALAEVRARKSQAQYAEASARAALRALTGIDDVHIADCPLALVAVELPEADAIGPSGRAELRMLAAGVAAREAEAAIHRSRYFPDLVLALSASYSVAPGITDVANPFIQDRGNNRGLGFGVAARWSLDFGGTRMRVLRAEAQLAEIEAQLEEAQLGADLEFRVARERLADASRRAGVWAQSERETRQWFVSSVQGYQVGVVEAKALVDSVKAYFAARASRLEAVLEHNLVLAQMERMAGHPLVDETAWEPHCE